MRVLVTGASGFIGSHSVREMVNAGHEVVCLARSPERIDAALRPLGSPHVRIARGDVLDRESVKAALVGIDAVVHFAGRFSYFIRDAAEMWRTNVEGTRIVLEEAVAAGCDPVIHVSSIVTILPLPRQGVPSAETLPLSTFRTPYIGSKTAAEALARGLQERGAPVVTTYPGGAWGAHDPAAGEMIHFMRAMLGNRYPFWMKGAGMSFVDVRWLARAHTALLEKGLGPRRVMMGGRYLPWGAIYRILRTLTGRTLPTVIPTMRAMNSVLGLIMDRIAQLTGVRLPITRETATMIYETGHTDDSIAIGFVGPHPPVERTMKEAIVWAVQAGHVPPKWAGKLAK